MCYQNVLQKLSVLVDGIVSDKEKKNNDLSQY